MLCPDCHESFDISTAHLSGSPVQSSPPQTPPKEDTSSLDDEAQRRHCIQPFQQIGSREPTPKRKDQPQHTPGKKQSTMKQRGQLFEARHPIILVSCGHSLCQGCLFNRFQQALINSGGSWDKSIKLSCNQCPECQTVIINKHVFQDLQTCKPHEHDRIVKILQQSFPVNLALLNLKRSFVHSRPACLKPSPDVSKKRLFWQDHKMHEDDEGIRQISMILEEDADRLVENQERLQSPSKHPLADDDQIDGLDPEYLRLQKDFQLIQAEMNQEIKINSDRQQKMTYLTQQTHDDAGDNNSQSDGSSEENYEEETDQEDVAEEGETDFAGKDLITKNLRKSELFQMSGILQDGRQSIGSDSQIVPISKRKKHDNLKCKIHEKKKIQAFCGDCLKLMCITCILDQVHKGHEMIDINQAAQEQRKSFFDGLRIAKLNQSELQNQILTVNNHISELEANSLKQREKIGQIFNEIRNKLLEREQLLKKRLSEMLETEQTLYKQKIQNLKDKIRCIKDLELEEKKLESENDMTVLQRCKLRGEILQDAKKEVQQQSLMNCIPKIKKEEELFCIVNMILPKKYRAQMLPSRIQNQVKRIKGLGSARRNDFGRNKKDSRGGYHHLDQSAGSQSQSSLYSGNIIGLPSSRLPHSQSNIRNRISKERFVKAQKIILHQRLNSQQHALQLKQLDNNMKQTQFGIRNSQGINLKNLSPNYNEQADSFENQAQIKLTQGIDMKSPTRKQFAARIESSRGSSNNQKQMKIGPIEQSYRQGTAQEFLNEQLQNQKRQNGKITSSNLNNHVQNPLNIKGFDVRSKENAIHRDSSISEAVNFNNLPQDIFWSQQSQKAFFDHSEKDPLQADVRDPNNDKKVTVHKWKPVANPMASSQQINPGTLSLGRQYLPYVKSKMHTRIQTAGMSANRKQNQKEILKTARREQIQQQNSINHNVNNASELVIIQNKLNQTVEQHQLVAITAQNTGERNDEIESMKTLKRGSSPKNQVSSNKLNSNSKNSFDKTNFRLYSQNQQQMGGMKEANEEQQKFVYVNKTIEQIEGLKQQLSLNQSEQSLLQQIDESDEVRDQHQQSSQNRMSESNHNPLQKKLSKEQEYIDDSHIKTQRGTKKQVSRYSEHLKLEPEQKLQKVKYSARLTQTRHVSTQGQSHGLQRTSKLQSLDQNKSKPKVRKFTQFQYYVAPAATDRSAKIDSIGLESSNILQKQKKGYADVIQNQGDTKSKSGSAQKTRKNKERSTGFNSPTSLPSPSAPRAPINIDKLTKTRLLYQDRGFSQGRTAYLQWLKKDNNEDSINRQKIQVYPEQQLDLKAGTEKLLSSMTRSNLDRTSDDQVRSLSKTRKHWKDKNDVQKSPSGRIRLAQTLNYGNVVQAASQNLSQIQNEQHDLSNENKNNQECQDDLFKLQNYQPNLIQETYYKKQQVLFNQKSNSNLNNIYDGFDTSELNAHINISKQFEARSLESSVSRRGKNSVSRGSINTIQRKQWQKKNSLSKQISDGIIPRPLTSALQQSLQRSPESVQTNQNDVKDEIKQSKSYMKLNLIQKDKELSDQPMDREQEADPQNQAAQIVNPTKTSLYQMILNSNQASKSSQAANGPYQADSQQRKKAVQQTQIGPQSTSVKAPKKSKSSLNKGIKNLMDQIATDDALNLNKLGAQQNAQKIDEQNQSKIGQNSLEKTGKNSASNANHQQASTLNQNSFKNAQLTNSFLQQAQSNQSNCTSQNKAILQNKTKSKPTAKTNLQANALVTTKQSQKKKKKTTKTKNDQKISSNNLQAVSQDFTALSSARAGQQHEAELEISTMILTSAKSKNHYSRTKQRNNCPIALTTGSQLKRMSSLKQLEQNKEGSTQEEAVQQISEKYRKNSKVKIRAEIDSDNEVSHKNILATVRELFEQTDRKISEYSEQKQTKNKSHSKNKLNIQGVKLDDENSCGPGDDDEASVEARERNTIEIRSAGCVPNGGISSVHNSICKNIYGQIKGLNDKHLNENENLAMMEAIAVKCKSPEPIRKTGILRRFDFTSPKKDLSQLKSRRDIKNKTTTKTIPRKKTDTKKLRMVKANEDDKVGLESCDEAIEIQKQDENSECKQSSPNRVDGPVNTNIAVESEEVLSGNNIDSQAIFEQKVRSRSSQVQEVSSRVYSTQQKFRQREIFVKTKHNFDNTSIERPVSRYSSCDFQVDDDERVDEPQFKKNPAPRCMEHRRGGELDIQNHDDLQSANDSNSQQELQQKIKQINQSSYSIAQMQPMRLHRKKTSLDIDNQEFKGKFGQNLHNYQEFMRQTEQDTFEQVLQQYQERKSSGQGGSNLVKKSIQKKLIKELGIDKEQNENQSKEEAADNFNINSYAHSNRSFSKPQLKLAEPTRAHSPLSAYSNITSSHSSKYQSVKIAPKDFGPSRVSSKNSGAIEHALSPSNRSRVKKLNVKSFIHNQTLSQMNQMSTPIAYPNLKLPFGPQASAIQQQAEETNLLGTQGSLLDILKQADLVNSNNVSSSMHVGNPILKASTVKEPKSFKIGSPMGPQRANKSGNNSPCRGDQALTIENGLENRLIDNATRNDSIDKYKNPVEAAIAEVKMHQSRKASLHHQYSEQKAVNKSRQIISLLDSGSKNNGEKESKRKVAGSSGKKRSRKIRKLYSIPSIQARSQTSLPEDVSSKYCQTISKPLTPIKMSTLANLNNYLHTPKDSFKAMNPVEGEYTTSMVSAQSKSDLYKVKEEYFFIFGGFSSQADLLSEGSNNVSKTIEVVDVSREICREFQYNLDKQQKEDQKQLSDGESVELQMLKMIGKQEIKEYPTVGFAAIQFQIDKQYAKKHDIKKFEERIYVIGGQDASSKVLDQVLEYSVNDTQTVFKADWKLPHDLAHFGVAQGSISRNAISQSIFIAGGLKQIGQDQTEMHPPIKSVYRLYLDDKKPTTDSLVLGTDMTTGLLFKCEILPEMTYPRSQFTLVFKSLNNEQDYELYAIGGVDRDNHSIVFDQDYNLDNCNSQIAIEMYSSQSRSWKVVDLKKQDDTGLGSSSSNIEEHLAALKGHQSILLPDDSIYIIGGSSSSYSSSQIDESVTDTKQNQAMITHFSNDVIKFDTATHQIYGNSIPKMNQARAFFTAVLSQNLRYIYVLGGFTPKKHNKQQSRSVSAVIPATALNLKNAVSLDSIEKLDTFSLKWSLVAPMKASRGMHALCQMIM